MGSTVPAAAGLDDDLNRVAREMEQLRAQVSEVRSERSELANLILDTGARLQALADQLAAARSRLAEADREIALTEYQIEDLSGRMAQREQRVVELGSDIDGVREAAVERAVQLYMRGDTDPALALFQAGDVNRFSVGIAYAARVQEAADGLIARLENLSVQEIRERDRLAIERADLEGQTEFLGLQRDERAAEAALVESRAAAVAAELAMLEEQLAQLQAQVAEIEGELAALQREESQIQALIAQQSNPGGPRPGALLRPVPGGVSSGYGYRIHPIYGTRILHTGWDMNAGCGEPIKAAESGTVISAGWRGGYGNAIIIDHGGGMSTLYGHQSRLGVSYGASVGIGDVIGWIGTTGVSTGCHLHFEVRIGGNPVDPTPYM